MASEFPYKPIRVDWKRPSIDKALVREHTRSSDVYGWLHCLGTLAILGTTGTIATMMYAQQRWLLMALALYVHGGVHAFSPQLHELSHNSVFRSKRLNSVFKWVFGIIHWEKNHSIRFRLSHTHHHRYTLHRRSEGEEVHPRPFMLENVIEEALRVVDPLGFVMAVYDRVRAIFTPFLRNPRRNIWQRYCHSVATPTEQRAADRADTLTFLFHVVFDIAAIASGMWFLVVVVTLPGFYGGKWYHLLIHQTMHVGREPETDDFRACCRTVRLDPVSSFLYWHMQWHTEHHTFPGMPCYRLKGFHKKTSEHWETPQSLAQAWDEMTRRSRAMLQLNQDSD